ncbi:Uncharacterised protein [Mycobacteroides abscessus subsp. abscessus]|nr:Uncharacterised protein [Mycobacteroides abscessus subsp. abscessus]
MLMRLRNPVCATAALSPAESLRIEDGVAWLITAPAANMPLPTPRCAAPRGEPVPASVTDKISMSLRSTRNVRG